MRHTRGTAEESEAGVELRRGVRRRAWFRHRQGSSRAVRSGYRSASGSHHAPPAYSVPPRPGNAIYSSPQDSVWRAAKASGLTSLLPQQVVIANSEQEILLNHMGEEITEAVRVQNAILIPACSRLPLLPNATEPDYAHADIHDLRDCLAATMSYYAVRRSAFALKIYVRGDEKAILDGETDVDRITAREVEEINAARTRLRPVAMFFAAS